MDPPPETPQWAERLAELASDLRAGAGSRARGEAWLLIRPAVRFRLERASARHGRLPAEDLADLASDKSLEILRSIETGQWRAAERTGREIAAFLSKVARNGVVDRLRAAGRTPRSIDDDSGFAATLATPALSAERRLARREFAEAVRDCVAKLDARRRRLWMMRAMLELPTKEIVRRTDSSLKPSHVDVLMKRTRETLSECLADKGHGAGDIERGLFGVLWRAFGAEIEALEEDSP